MGSVLTPLMVGIEKTGPLPNACTLNGRCQEVCPMQIPLPSMLLKLREQEFEQGLQPAVARAGLAAWVFLARRPKLYSLVTRLGIRALALLGRRKGRFRRLPFAGAWTDARDLPAPAGETFQQAWKRRRRGAG